MRLPSLSKGIFRWSIRASKPSIIVLLFDALSIVIRPVYMDFSIREFKWKVWWETDLMRNPEPIYDFEKMHGKVYPQVGTFNMLKCYQLHRYSSCPVFLRNM